MTALDGWLKQAVRGLSRESAETVRREIEEHYEAAREAAVRDGVDPQRAEFAAVEALGDACEANRQYRKVLLTKSEAAVLRNSNAESRRICANGWAKWVLLSAPGILLLISVFCLAVHMRSLARGVLVLGVLMALFFIAPFMPIYTVGRGRVYRTTKWVAMVGCVLALVGVDGWNWAWLNACCFCPVIYVEWKRMMIRRKLPISRWPKQLYL